MKNPRFSSMAVNVAASMFGGRGLGNVQQPSNIQCAWTSVLISISGGFFWQK